MGLLRLLLALAVVQEHAGSLFGYRILTGMIAVKVFFIISGFYIALILNEKYRKEKNWYWLFITNRFLRIYPLYWFVLAVFSIFLFFIPTLASNVASIPLPLQLVKNIFLFISLDYFVYITKLYSELYIYQAWTLGLELFFYMLAPLCAFLSLKKSLLVFVGTILLRIIFTHVLSLYPIALVDHFFPTLICFFVAGICSYHFYTVVQTKKFFIQIVNKWFTTSLIITLLLPLYPSSNIYADNKIIWIYFLCIAISLPALFYKTKGNKVDRAIGNLSYPIYITHGLILSIFHILFPGFTSGNYFVICVIAATFFFSFLLERVIIKPIDFFRWQRLKEK